MAQAIIGALRAELSAGVARFADDMNRAGDQVRKFGREFRRVGGSMRTFGRNFSTQVSAPIIAFGGFALKAAGDFEQSMNRVQALTGSTGDELEALTEQAKELGATTQFSASQAADGMGFLAQAGFDAQQILETMPATLQLAAAAQIDLARAADIASNILQSQQMETSELAHVTDVLTAAFANSNTDLEMLAEAFKFAGPITKQFGIQFEEAVAAIGLMGNAGIQASLAGTALRGALTKLVNPSDEVAGLMERLGINALDAQGNMLPMKTILLQLERAFGEVSKGVLDANGQMIDTADAIEVLRGSGEQGAALMQIFGLRAGPGMAALLGQGSDALEQFTTDLENSGGTAERIANVQMQGFNGAVREMKSAFEALQIALGESGFLQMMTDFIKRLANWTRSLAKANPEMLRMGLLIAGVVAAAGPLIIMLGAVVTAIGLLSTVTGGVVVAIAALATAFLVYHEQILGFVNRMVEGIDNALGGRLPQIINGAKAVLKFLAEQFALVVQMIGQLLTGDFSGALESFGELWRNAWNATVAVLQGVAGVITEVLNGLIDRLDEAMGGRLKPILDGAAAVLQFFVDQVRLLFTAIGQLFTGDFRGAMETFNEMWSRTWNGAVTIIGRAVEEITSWLKGRLGDTMDWVSNKVETVKDSFKSLYQAVVGGSYIPDMVNGIISEMQRLQAGFVKPAADMTANVEKSFDDLGQKMRSVWDELVATGTVSMQTLVSLAATALDKWVGIGDIFSSSPGGGGSFASAVSTIFGAAFGGGLANGGLAMAGRPYVVGEQGPELFVPATSGMVEPDGGGGVTQIFNITTPDANSFRRSERQIMRSARQRLSMG